MTNILDDARPQMARQLELPLTQHGEARPAQRSEEAKSADAEPTDPGRACPRWRPDLNLLNRRIRDPYVRWCERGTTGDHPVAPISILDRCGIAVRA